MHRHNVQSDLVTNVERDIFSRANCQGTKIITLAWHCSENPLFGNVSMSATTMTCKCWDHTAASNKQAASMSETERQWPLSSKAAYKALSKSGTRVCNNNSNIIRLWLVWNSSTTSLQLVYTQSAPGLQLAYIRHTTGLQLVDNWSTPDLQLVYNVYNWHMYDDYS